MWANQATPLHASCCAPPPPAPCCAWLMTGRAVLKRNWQPVGPWFVWRPPAYFALEPTWFEPLLACFARSL